VRRHHGRSLTFPQKNVSAKACHRFVPVEAGHRTQDLIHLQRGTPRNGHPPARQREATGRVLARTQTHGPRAPISPAHELDETSVARSHLNTSALCTTTLGRQDSYSCLGLDLRARLRGAGRAGSTVHLRPAPGTRKALAPDRGAGSSVHAQERGQGTGTRTATGRAETKAVTTVRTTGDNGGHSGTQRDV
jgi:hypothetical protein